MSGACEAFVGIRAVTFDATGTLFHCPDLGSIYSEVLARHGADVSSRRVAELVQTVWREFACRPSGTSHGRDAGAPLLEDRFGSNRGESRDWWTDFIARILEYLESPIEPAFATVELLDRFSRPESWEVFPEAPEVLSELRARGYLLGIVSNWDHRLPALLEGLELGGFDALAYSAEVDFEKPHPAIFQACFERLGVPAAACLHVGNRSLEDFEGSQGAGMASLLVERRRPSSAISGLREILARLPRLAELGS